MAMAVSFDGSVALSVSADHLVGKYDLNVCDSRNQPDALTYLPKTYLQPDSVDSAGTVHRTKHPGNGAVAIHDEGRVCAIGGWDGR
jgi:hypothetical protein